LKAKEPRDRSASVRARLLDLARDRGEDFQITLRNYLFERFLYRLSRSELRERFVLKSAMLLRLWATSHTGPPWIWTCFRGATPIRTPWPATSPPSVAPAFRTTLWFSTRVRSGQRVAEFAIPILKAASEAP